MFTTLPIPLFNTSTVSGSDRSGLRAGVGQARRAAAGEIHARRPGAKAPRPLGPLLGPLLGGNKSLRRASAEAGMAMALAGKFAGSARGKVADLVPTSVTC